MNLTKKHGMYLIPLISFFVIVAAINIYQYYQVKQDIRTNLIQGINTSDLKEIQAFFTSISSKISIVRDWGKNGVLDLSKRSDLNKKFMPLIQHQPFLSGLVLADTEGREYFLFSEDQAITTRSTTQADNSAFMRYATWSSPVKTIREWEETREYDPRKRPWFHDGVDETEIRSTDIYTFFHSREQGFTVSVAWNDPTKEKKTMVFGFDIRLDQISNLLSTINNDKPTILFLVSNRRVLPVTSLGAQSQTVDGQDILSRSLLPSIMEKWQAAGYGTPAPVVLEYQGKSWVASFQPLDTENQTIWLGTAVTENDLLAMLNASLFKIEKFELLLAGAISLLILLVLWRSGLLSPDHVSIPPEDRLAAYIQQGEGAQVEYKSTLRMNLKTNKPGKEIELAWLKAICAFLNSKGGALLVGVNDEGEVIGIDADGFENEDRCLLHVKNLINQHIGAEFSSFLSLSVLTLSGKQVVMMESQPTGVPVFLKIGKNEEYYVRSGPSSVKLSPSQMIRYVLQHQYRAFRKR